MNTIFSNFYKALLILSFISICNQAFAGSKEKVVIGFSGLTIHGIAPDTSAREYMPRKLDAYGFIVSHPEVSLTYFSKDNTQTNLTFLKDCMDKPAVNLGYGKYKKFDNFRAGYILSLYAREKFKKSIIIEDENGNRFQRDIKAQQFLFSAENNGWEYIFLPMLTLSYDFVIYNDIGLNLMLGSNFAINHFTLGLSF